MLSPVWGVNTERGERELVKRKYKRVKANPFSVQAPSIRGSGPFSYDQCCVLSFNSGHSHIDELWSVL